MLRLIKRPEEAGGEKLTAAGYSPQLARLLAMRGVHTPEEARRFLNPSMDDLSEPKAIYGMEAPALRDDSRGDGSGARENRRLPGHCGSGRRRARRQRYAPALRARAAHAA